MGKSYGSTPRVRKASGVRTVNSEKVSFYAHFRDDCKTYPPYFRFQFNSGTSENVQILPLNLILIPMHAD